ncbi:MAG TPA: TonB-dependent receptor [Puia sp.]|nr:TonB-dependent receptor [Puia sp.]
MRNTHALLIALFFTGASFRGLSQNAPANGEGARGNAHTASATAPTDPATAPATAEKSQNSSAGPEDPFSGKVTGRIGDANGQPVEAATITLLNAKDSSKLKSTTSGKTGQFSFDHLATGKYIVSASSVGYSPAWSPAFELSPAQTSLSLPPMILVSATTSLKAVSVVAKKPLIEVKADRTIVNVDASPSNAGSTVMDVLEKSPGVTLDKDDNVSLKGKQGVTIMIDNKPTYLSASQLASYLRSLPASAVDQIELMTNPSAKYDASGNSGIINIKTKKNKLRGFNGNVNLTHTQGVYPKPSGSFNLNYRDGKANFFVNGGYSRWEGFQHLDITRKYLDGDAAKTINSIFTQTTEMHFLNPEMNLKLGMDYYVTPKTTVGFVVSGFRNKEQNRSSSNIRLMDPHYNVDSFVYSPSTNNTTWKNGSANINFRHQFDSAGRELTADLDYVRYSSGSDQYFDNITYTPDMQKKNETVLTGNLPSVINIYTFKTDYTRPLAKGYKLEAGAKFSYVNTDNNANYFNLDPSTQISSVDTTKTNHFIYKENVNALYVNLTKQIKKLSIQAGLRAENTNYSGHQLGNGLSVINRDSSFKRSYVNLFPTVYLSYDINDKNQVTLNYGRRIDRPAYQDLNPFLFFLDQYTYQAGNPYLQPQYTQNVEASHTYNHFLTTTLNYSYTENFFTETFEQSGHATIVRNGNIGKRQNAGISVSAQIPVSKWWTTVLYSNLNYSKFSGMLYGENIDVNATTVLFNVTNQFTFSHGWGGEISGFYRTKGIEGQVVIQPLGQGSAAISKKILKDKGSLKLAVRDIFYTNKPKGYINFQQTEATFANYRDSRQVAMTFTYNFGKPLKGMGGKRRSGAGEEESRVKTGGNN